MSRKRDGGRRHFPHNRRGPPASIRVVPRTAANPAKSGFVFEHQEYTQLPVIPSLLRFIVALVLFAAVQACQQPASPTAQVWRASEDNGDKPGIGYELRVANGAVAGDAYILDPDHPRDFARGKRAAMTIVEQSPREIIFRVRWSRDLKATLRFRFKQADWPDSFQATVTEINGSEEYDTDMYSFVRIKTGRPP